MAVPITLFSLYSYTIKYNLRHLLQTTIRMNISAQNILLFHLALDWLTCHKVAAQNRRHAQRWGFLLNRESKIT